MLRKDVFLRTALPLRQIHYGVSSYQSPVQHTSGRNFAYTNRFFENNAHRKSKLKVNSRSAKSAEGHYKKKAVNPSIYKITPSDWNPSLMERKKFTSRFPETFISDVKNWEVENSKHLKAVEQHLIEQGFKFNNWYLAQQALTHFNYPSMRGKHNSLISRFGEKALRMFLTEFITISDPVCAKKEWFIISNLNTIMRNDFVVDNVSEKLKLAQIVRYKKWSFRQTSRESSFVFFVHSRAVFALIGSIYLDQGMESAKAFVSKYFLEPFRVDGVFKAPIRQPRYIPHCID